MNGGITLFSAGTTRGLPPCILLEESGVEYQLVRVDLRGREPPPALLAAGQSPGRVPFLVDGDRRLDQSVAILIYLSEKFGRFLPTEEPARSEVFRVLSYAVTDVLPLHATIFHLRRQQAAWRDEVLFAQRRRLVSVLACCEALLASRDHVAVDLSIADFALYAILGQYDPRSLDRNGLSATRSWVDRIRARPAVAAAERRNPYDFDVSDTLDEWDRAVDAAFDPGS